MSVRLLVNVEWNIIGPSGHKYANQDILFIFFFQLIADVKTFQKMCTLVITGADVDISSSKMINRYFCRLMTASKMHASAEIKK